jgi:hypothetical protein
MGDAPVDPRDDARRFVQIVFPRPDRRVVLQSSLHASREGRLA